MSPERKDQELQISAEYCVTVREKKQV